MKRKTFNFTVSKKFKIVFDENFLRNKNTGIDNEIVSSLAFLNMFPKEHRKYYERYLRVLGNKKDYDKRHGMNWRRIKRKYKRLKDSIQNRMRSLDIFKNKVILEIIISTQDDSNGPSDLIFKFTDNTTYGFSIKGNNNVQCNPTGKKFLTEHDIEHFTKKLPSFIHKYIETNNEVCEAKKWFRTGSSINTYNELIFDVCKFVEKNWDDFSLTYRQEILDELNHIKSKTKYSILNINEINGTVKLIEPPKFIDASTVTIKHDVGTHYVLFYTNDILFGKLQVKFNNGILERDNRKKLMNTHKRHKLRFVVDGINMKEGNLFSSWNWQIVYT